MGRLPSSSLFKRRVKRSLYNSMTARFKLLPKYLQQKQVEESLVEDEYTARDAYAKHGHHGIQTKDITAFSGGRAVASHKGQHLALKNDKVTVFSNHADALQHLKEDQMDEISRETKVDYAMKAFQHGNELQAQLKNTTEPEAQKQIRDKISKRNQGVIKVSKSLKEDDITEYTLDELVEFMMTEEYSQLDELSKDALKNYITAAHADADVEHRMNNRAKGIVRALGKLLEAVSVGDKELLQGRAVQGRERVNQTKADMNDMPKSVSGGEKGKGNVEHGFRSALKRLYKKLDEEQVEESANHRVTVATNKYSWGTMKVIHKGSAMSVPLHPEHHEALAKLADGETHHFTDETRTRWRANREGDNVHLKSDTKGTVSVPHSALAEDSLEESAQMLANKQAELKKLKAQKAAGSPLGNVDRDIDKARAAIKKLKAQRASGWPLGEDEEPEDLSIEESIERILNEGFTYPGSRSILPASQALHDKAKSSIADIVGTWGHNKMTVHVAQKENGNHVYIAGSGHRKHDTEAFHAHHDQTRRNMGAHKVVNTIHLEGGKIVHKENDIGTNKAHPLYVYK